MHAPPPPPPKPHHDDKAHHPHASKPVPANPLKKSKEGKEPKKMSLQDQIKARRPKDDVEANVDPDLPTVPINLFACGSGTYGRLAQAPNNEENVALLSQCRSYTPVTFEKIACGAGHTLALDNEGRVWSWGKCHYGQLGHGKVWKDERLPKRIEALTERVALIGAGWSFSLALTQSKKLFAFGCGFFGALGNDSEETHATPVPVALHCPEGVKVVKICGGAYHAGVVLSDGSALVWGANTHAQLGLGDVLNRKVPQKLKLVENGVEFKIRDMSMGETFTAFVTECGRVFWCGEEDLKIPRSEKPTYADGNTASTAKIVACDATAAGLLLLDTDGFIYTTFELKSSPPSRITKWPNGKEPKFTTISCGQNHSIVISTEEEIFAWGRGAFYGSKLSRTNPNVPQNPALMECLPEMKGKKPLAVDGGSNHSFVLVKL